MTMSKVRTNLRAPDEVGIAAVLLLEVSHVGVDGKEGVGLAGASTIEALGATADEMAADLGKVKSMSRMMAKLRKKEINRETEEEGVGNRTLALASS